MTVPVPVHRAVVGGQELADLRAWAWSVEAWPAGSHLWGHYAEQTEAGPVICRTENVSACHEGFAAMVRGALRELAASYVGTAVVDFKDKLNYKHPGGAGFRPHQDLVAYPGAAQVVSVLVAVDECTTTSGCLWMDPGVDTVLPVDGRGVVAAETAAGLSWTPVELGPGDAVCIGGLVPHFSEANRSAAKRRVLVASYAPESTAYTRAAYYGARKKSMDGAVATDRVRISTLDDFEGKALEGAAGPPRGGAPAGPAGPAGCTHD